MNELNLFEVPIQGRPFLKWAGGKGQLLDAIDANIKIGTATLLAGAALAHQVRKHHKHDDARGITSDRLDTWDDEFDDGFDDAIYDYNDAQYCDDNDYEYQQAAYEEQVAYDDFIASMDMADD